MKNPIAHRVDHRAIAGLEPIVAIRHAAAMFGVEEVERSRVDAAPRKFSGEIDHERVALISARAVAKDKRDARGVARLGRIEQGGHLVAPARPQP